MPSTLDQSDLVRITLTPVSPHQPKQSINGAVMYNTENQSPKVAYTTLLMSPFGGRDTVMYHSIN